MRNGVLVVALVLLAWIAVRLTLPVPAPAPSVPGPPGGPSFVVQVVKPRGARPLAGMLPDGLFGLPTSALSFDHASPGAEVVAAAPDRLALRADGWEFLLAVDAGGRPTPDTRVVFSLELAERMRTLRARPADGAPGHLTATPRPGADVLDGDFQVELSICEDAGTGKALDWPGAPFTVRGMFTGLPATEPR